MSELKVGISWKTRDVHSASFEESNSQRELDRRLDQALEDTFPASDPVAILISKTRIEAAPSDLNKC